MESNHREAQRSVSQNSFLVKGVNGGFGVELRIKKCKKAKCKKVNDINAVNKDILV